MMTKIKSFTLMEVIIVLIITAAILGLGITSYSNATKSTTVSEATGDVITILKQTQNMAKNNTIPKNELGTDKAESIYYYIVEFKQSEIARYLFRKKDNAWSPDATTAVISEPTLKSKAFGNVKYHINNGECQYVLFENLTGKIKVSTSLGLNAESIYTNTTEECQLTIGLTNDSNYTKKVFINATDGTFGIKGETP